MLYFPRSAVAAIACMEWLPCSSSPFVCHSCNRQVKMGQVFLQIFLSRNRFWYMQRAEGRAVLPVFSIGFHCKTGIYFCQFTVAKLVVSQIKGHHLLSAEGKRRQHQGGGWRVKIWTPRAKPKNICLSEVFRTGPFGKCTLMNALSYTCL